MRFKDFLTEASIEHAVKIFQQHCTDWDPEYPLYRAAGKLHQSDRRPIGQYETGARKGESKAGTQDLQNWTFSLPEWEEFPNRKRSIFCGTTNSTVFHTGSRHQYCVFPFNGTKLAVTEVDDFNHSRVIIENVDDIEYMEFPYWLSTIIRRGIGDDTFTGTAERAWKIIKNAAENVKGPIVNKARYERLVAIAKSLPEALTPQKLKVYLFTTETFKESKWSQIDHEVWFEGKYLLIPEDQLTDFQKAL